MTETPTALFPGIDPERYIYRPGCKIVHVAVDLRQIPRPHCGGGCKAHEVVDWKVLPTQVPEGFSPCVACLRIELRKARRK